MNIGDRLLMFRKKNHLSQEEVALRLNVSRQTISNWELGETCPDLKTAVRLSNIYNITLDELVCNDTRDILIKKINDNDKINRVLNILEIVTVIPICIYSLGYAIGKFIYYFIH